MFSNYTHDNIKNTLQLLCGVVVRSVDLHTGELLEPAGVGLAPLSTAHTGTRKSKNGGRGVDASNVQSPASPFVEWRAGASILKVSKAEPAKQTGGGRRGIVKGFSIGARRRLLRLFAGIRRDAVLPVFVTLTYPKSFPEPRQSKKHLKCFIQRMKRAFPEGGGVWKLEPQKRGAPHYHLLVWNISAKDLRGWVPTAWFDIAGGEDPLHLLWHEGKLKNRHCVQQVKFFNGVMAYASKYIGKTFEVAGWDSKAVGKFWGVLNPANIPFGEPMKMDITRGEAVQAMRYQRRKAKLKSRSYPSITIFCDSEQWIDKVFGGDEK